MALGDYEKTIYVNGQAPGISAQNLNRNENKTEELDTTLATHLAEAVYLQEDEPEATNSTTLWFDSNSEVNFSEGGVVVENAEVSPTPPSEENLWFSIIE